MPQAMERLFATPMIKPRLPARMPWAFVSAIIHLDRRWISRVRNGLFSRPGDHGEALLALSSRHRRPCAADDGLEECPPTTASMRPARKRRPALLLGPQLPHHAAG